MEFSNLSGYCEGTLRCSKLQTLRSNLAAHDSCYVFFQLLKELRYKKFHKLSSSHLYSEALSGYSQELRVLPSNMTAQILVFFAI